VETSIPARLRVITRDVKTSTENLDSGKVVLNAGAEAQNLSPGEKLKVEATEKWRKQESLQSDYHDPKIQPSAFLSTVTGFCSCSLLPLRRMALLELTPPKALRVPMFYAYRRWRDKITETVFIGPIMGVIFGTVHLLA
jgi:hypothetical protein